jgi:hypothetical protein
MTLVAPASTERTGDAPAARERYSYDRGDFTWRWHQDGTWSLHVEGRRGAVLDVVRDEAHPQMWRIRHPDGRLSDMVNLTRAKEAAATMALAVLNQSGDARTDGGRAQQKEKHKSAVQVPSDMNRAPSGDGESNLPSHIPEAAE